MTARSTRRRLCVVVGGALCLAVVAVAGAVPAGAVRAPAGAVRAPASGVVRSATTSTAGGSASPLPPVIGTATRVDPDDEAAWTRRVKVAIRYALRRRGRVSFAVITPAGRLRCWHCGRVEPSQSVAKAMLMVAYLRRASVRGRSLRSADRALLVPMIRWSDNVTAHVVFDIVGRSGLRAVARLVPMRRFTPRNPWYLTRITAADQARLFRKIDALVPRRHRAFAMRLLATIVPSQRWGIPHSVPRGWRIYFKGGWGDGGGDVVHQIALLRRGRRRIVIAILTRFNPNHVYGARTLRSLSARLLAGI